MKKHLITFLTFVGLKRIILNNLITFKFRIFKTFHALFNKTVIQQNKDYKSIPIIIISFNQLFYLNQLIDFLKQHNYTNIVIIDNNSTYSPLIDYFDKIETQVTIHRLKVNHGHLVFWKEKELFNLYSKGYYVITDADINPIAECPEDFLKEFKRILDKHTKITKAGFSLKIDNIPENNLNKEKILKWEAKFWRKKNIEGNFIAGIDTTFALYRPNYYHKEYGFLRAIRTNYPYTAKHGGWYIDNNNLTNEQKFYFENCNASSTWRIDEKGKLRSLDYQN